MMTIRLTTLILLLLFSCTESTQETEKKKNVSESVNDQTEKVEEPIDDTPLNPIMKSLEKKYQSVKTFDLPFSVDKDSLSDLKPKSPLNLEEFEYLTENFSPLEKNEGYYIGKGKEIYKLKASKAYENYLETLDLAQVKDIVAYPYGLIEIDDALLLLWRLDFSSYEACPFYSGTELYVSIIREGKCISSVLLAEEWSGGDPPSFGEFYTKMKINKKGKVDRTIFSCTYEDDELIDSSKNHIQHQLEW